MATGVTVGGLLDGRARSLGLTLELIAGAAGVDRPITSPHAQKTGLALAGFENYLHAGRVFVFGESEIRYLEGLSPADRSNRIRQAFSQDIPCLLLTAGVDGPPELAAEADRASVPLLRTPLPTPTAIAKLTAILEDSLAERQVIHAGLLDILGLGVLIIGDSSIGKSECALDLIVRGHRLVADDTVEVRRRSETLLIGSCPELTRNHMEVRGLGLINIQDLFGIAATRSSKRIELVVQLERWESGRDYDRLGLAELSYELLGLSIPLIRMPVAPGRNVATLVEVAARNQLLRARGHHAARKLVARVDRRISQAVAREAEDDEDGGDGA